MIDDATEPDEGKGTYTGEHEHDDPPQAGSFTGANESGVEQDGAFTESEIPADAEVSGGSEVGKHDVEGAYTEKE